MQRKCREYLQQEACIQYALRGVQTEREYANTFVLSGTAAMVEHYPSSVTTRQLSVCRITGSEE